MGPMLSEVAEGAAVAVTKVIVAWRLTQPDVEAEEALSVSSSVSVTEASGSRLLSLRSAGSCLTSATFTVWC